MRLGIFTDIHEDALRLDEALRLFEKSNCDQLVCLGDITGFDVMYYRYISTRNASKCISLIKSNCKYVVAGNHDLFSIRKIPKSNGFFSFPDNWYDLDFSERERLSDRKIWLFEHQELSSLLSKADKEYIASLPEYIATKMNDIGVFFSHSIYPDFTGSLILRPKNHWDFNEHFGFLKKNGCMIGFSGHLHPSGYGKATQENYDFYSFGVDKFKYSPVQYISPCISNSANKNGFLIADFNNMTVESIKLNSKRYQSKFFV